MIWSIESLKMWRMPSRRSGDSTPHVEPVTSYVIYNNRFEAAADMRLKHTNYIGFP